MSDAESRWYDAQDEAREARNCIGCALGLAHDHDKEDET